MVYVGVALGCRMQQLSPRAQWLVHKWGRRLLLIGGLPTLAYLLTLGYYLGLYFCLAVPVWDSARASLVFVAVDVELC